MVEKKILFDNNEGLGGFEKGGYDIEAQHPTDVNWTRQSRFIIPDQPKLIWKVTTDNAYVDSTTIKGSFVVDRNKNVLVTDCDNNLVGKHQGRLFQISFNGEKKEIFSTNIWLKSPVIGKDGFIYVTTTGYQGPIGHKLYCLFPDGSVKWEYLVVDDVCSKPVLDNLGNVYIYTYDDKVGTLFSIRDDGTLNWEYKFNSINWFEPIVSMDGIIYIGLNVNKTLCAFDKDGKKLWERALGQGLGSFPLIIKNDGTIYACLSGTLFALNSDGSTIWEYKPEDGYVETSPALDKEGNLYINLSAFKLVSLNSEGKEQWQTIVQGDVIAPPIIGDCNKIFQISFMQHYPQYKSWIESYSKEGEKIWTYELKGTILSAVLADDNLIYALVNCHTHSKKGWKDKINVKWELHAIGKS